MNKLRFRHSKYQVEGYTLLRRFSFKGLKEKPHHLLLSRSSLDLINCPVMNQTLGDDRLCDVTDLSCSYNDFMLKFSEEVSNYKAVNSVEIWIF